MDKQRLVRLIREMKCTPFECALLMGWQSQATNYHVPACQVQHATCRCAVLWVVTQWKSRILYIDADRFDLNYIDALFKHYVGIVADGTQVVRTAENTWKLCNGGRNAFIVVKPKSEIPPGTPLAAFAQ